MAVNDGSSQDTASQQSLPGMRAPISLAPKMAASVGIGSLLLPALSTEQAPSLGKINVDAKGKAGLGIPTVVSGEITLENPTEEIVLDFPAVEVAIQLEPI